jgi:hypothetical protein
MEDVLALLIPIIGVSIPFVVVAGRFVVQPIVGALSKLAEAQNAARAAGPIEQRLAATEQHLIQLERKLDRVLEEQDFQRNLLSSRSASRSAIDAR